MPTGFCLLSLLCLLKQNPRARILRVFYGPSEILWCNQEINGKESERKVKQELLEIKGTENIVTQN